MNKSLEMVKSFRIHCIQLEHLDIIQLQTEDEVLFLLNDWDALSIDEMTRILSKTYQKLTWEQSLRVFIQLDDLKRAHASPWVGSTPIGVVGGTFDHLHSGHRVLLAIAAWSCSETLFIGLSGPDLLEKKQFKHLIQPFHLRQEKILDFINRTAPWITVEIEELRDSYGPSLRPEVSTLFLSEESEAGGALVNRRRAELQLEQLQLVSIPVLESSDGMGKQSSTEIRRILSSV